jgi:hypothetical protein
MLCHVKRVRGSDHMGHLISSLSGCSCLSETDDPDAIPSTISSPRHKLLEGINAVVIACRADLHEVLLIRPATAGLISQTSWQRHEVANEQD